VEDPRREDPPDRARDRAGWALIALGLVGILWGVLYMDARALGGAPEQRDFAHRRSYDTVKQAAHSAFPGFLLRAGSGFVLLLVGAQLRRGAAR
jgi:hypothetical protein